MATTAKRSEVRIDRPRATVIGAIVEGWRRVLRAPAVVAGLVLLTIIVALPAAALVGGELRRQLGTSLDAEPLQFNWNETWATGVASQSRGLVTTFTHEILGFGGTLSAVSSLMEGRTLVPAGAMLVAGYLALWTILSGGVLDRLARGRPLRASGFFAACGVHLFRFLRMALVTGPIYWATFRWWRPLLLERLFAILTRGVTSEIVAMLIYAALLAVFLITLMWVSLWSDFAKVRVVVEDRRSAIGALGAGWRFIRRRPFRVTGLYLLNVLVLLVVLRLWLQVSPGTTTGHWQALLASQVFLVGRMWAKLAFMASEVAFFQGELAHGGYTAAPLPMWPDSPAVEAVRNLRRRP